jgi:hypothetical protein
MLKIIFKNKKIYFEAFPSKKNFKKQPQPHSNLKYPIERIVEVEHKK